MQLCTPRKYWSATLSSRTQPPLGPPGKEPIFFHGQWSLNRPLFPLLYPPSPSPLLPFAAVPPTDTFKRQLYTSICIFRNRMLNKTATYKGISFAVLSIRNMKRGVKKNRKYIDIRRRKLYCSVICQYSLNSQ